MEVTGAECLPHTYQELLDYLGQLEYGATGGYRLDTVQDFLIMLGIKPCVHILEISIFSLNDDMSEGIFLIFFSVKNIKLGDQLSLMKFFLNFENF